MQQLMQGKLKFIELDHLNGNFLFLKSAQFSSYYEIKCQRLSCLLFRAQTFAALEINEQRTRK